jgi:hypothetical protein
MGSIEDYPIEFVRRTKEILQKKFDYFKKEEDREVTFLLNCLLGLIVTVSEEENRKLKVFKGKIEDDFLDLVPKKIGFVKKIQVDDTFDLIQESVAELNVPIGHWDVLIREDKFWFLNKIRNAIAHQHIKGVNENGKWVGVKLWNESANGKDFEIVYTIEQLRKFAIEISDKYLSEKSPKKTEQ